MTTHVVDLSDSALGWTVSHMVIPRSHGWETTLAAHSVYYPSDSMWGQFMFFHDNSANGLLVHVADSSPEIQQWTVVATEGSESLTITFPSDTTPTDIREIDVGSADWEDAADIYQAWAMEQTWWKRLDDPWMNRLNYLFTGSNSSGAALTTSCTAMANALRNNVAVWVRNYRTSAVSEDFPDYTVDTVDGYDASFSALRNIGVVPFCFMSGLLWDMDEGSYNFENMIWHKPVTITSASDEGDGTYDFQLAADIAPALTIGVNDQVTITDSTNSSANGEVFTVSAVTSNTVFTATHATGIGAINDGSCYLIARDTDSQIDLKVMCLDVASNKTRLATERAGLVDDNGSLTEVYIDVINARQPTICYNPNHDHDPGDCRQWIDNSQELMTTLRGKGRSIVEGFSEQGLGLANGYLRLSGTGEDKLTTLIPMITRIYGRLTTIIGWKMATLSDNYPAGGEDTTVDGYIDDAYDNFSVDAIMISGLSIDNAIFDGTLSTSLANLKARRKEQEKQTRVLK